MRLVKCPTDFTSSPHFSLNSGNTTDIGIRADAWRTTSQESDIYPWQETVTSGSFVGCWSNNQAGAPKAPTDRLVFTNSTGGFHNYWIGVFAIGNPNTNRIDSYFDGEENFGVDQRELQRCRELDPNQPPFPTCSLRSALLRQRKCRTIQPAYSTIDGRMKPDLDRTRRNQQPPS